MVTNPSPLTAEDAEVPAEEHKGRVFSAASAKSSASSAVRFVAVLILFGFVTVFHVLPSSAQQIRRATRYPAHWWTPVIDPKKPDWEILPQEAGPREVILSKRNELGLLSNFAPTPFVFHGLRYASLEGFWQMMKYPEGPSDPRAKFPGLEWKYTRAQVAQMTGFEAKAAGTIGEANMKILGVNWVSFEGDVFEYRPSVPGEHYRLIVAATRAKVRQNPKAKKLLLSTRDLILKPDHHQEPNAPAAWRYFEILTTIRSELQKTQ
jgi:predicted NAD-dependent protein-ADP-ribosyltransferase YbiA (DUF1768 family)